MDIDFNTGHITIADFRLNISQLPEENRDLSGDITIDYDTKTVNISLRQDIVGFSINEEALRNVIDSETRVIPAGYVITSIKSDPNMVRTCQFFVPNTIAVRDLNAEVPADWMFNRPNIQCMCTNPTLTSNGMPVPCQAVIPDFTGCGVYTASDWRSVLTGTVNGDEVVSLQKLYRHLRVPFYRVVHGTELTEYSTFAQAKQVYDEIVENLSAVSQPVSEKRVGFFDKVLCNATSA